MRRILMLATVFLALLAPAYAQIPSINNTESFYPPLSFPLPFYNVINHVANYDLVNPHNPNERYSVWASNHNWRNGSGPTNTLSWRREDIPSGTIINQGHINDIDVAVPGDYAIELEPAIFIEGGRTFVVVAYYAASNDGWMGNGHFYNIYEWTPAGLVLVSINPLSSAPRYARISIDAFKSYTFAITWEDAGGVYVKTWHDGYAPKWSPTLFVAGSATGMMPDVSVSGIPGTWIVRIAYRINNFILVYYQDINLIQTATGTSIAFNFEDFWSTTYFTPASGSLFGNYKSDFARCYFHITAPQQSMGPDTWTCVYNDNSNSVKARIRHAGSLFTPDITTLFPLPPPYAGYRKEFPTVSYDAGTSTYGNAIYFGFNVVTNTSSGDHYLAAKTDLSGNPIVPDFMEVSDPSMSTVPGYSGGIAFPKYTALADDLFITFVGRETATGNDFLVTKKIPWGDMNFRPAPAAEEALPQAGITAGPNPFRERFTVKAADMKAPYAIRVTDITGKVLYHHTTSLTDFNNNTSLPELLSPGILLVDIAPAGNTPGKAQQLKLVKLR